MSTKPNMNKWIVIVLLVASIIPYVIGQWIDGDNLLLGLELKPFWQFQIRNCPAC